MSTSDAAIVTRVRTILEEVVGPSVADLENPSRESVPAWDSLAHVEVFFALEEEFSVRFSADQLRSLTSLDAIVEVLVHDQA